MLGLKKQIFGDKGYATDLILSDGDLALFRSLVSKQWQQVIKASYPEFEEEAVRLGIQNYHTMADRIDHKRLWPKSARVLTQSDVKKIKELDFFSILRREFGDFAISDVYDTFQHFGEEEIYWRLVRPNHETDVGPLHADKWFHTSFNKGHGMFPPDVVTVKMWIPLYSELGKNGLKLVKGSHLKDWRFHLETTDGLPKPIPDEDLTKLDAALIAAAPGNAILFHENTLHGGAINHGEYTRVSAEITLVLTESR